MMSGEPTTSPRDPLPADFLCPACGYDLSAARVERCSECGLKIDDEIIAADGRRNKYLETAWFTDLLIGLSPIGLMAVCIALIITPPDADVGLGGLIFGAIFGAFILLPSLLATIFLSLSALPGHKRATFCGMFGAHTTLLLPLIATTASLLLWRLFEPFVTTNAFPLPSVLTTLLCTVGGIILSRYMWPRMRARAVYRAGLHMTHERRRSSRIAAFVAELPSTIVLVYVGVVFVVRIIL